MKEYANLKEIPSQPTPLSDGSIAALHSVEEYLSKTLTGPRTPLKGKHWKGNVTLLQSVPEEERDSSWFSALAILLCLHRKLPEVASRVSRLQAKHLEGSDPGEMARFNEKLSQASFPYILGRHGFKVPFRNRSLDEIATGLTALIDRIVEVTGKEVFINSGTLLGAVRNKDFIAHDDDIDLGIHLTDQGEEQAAIEFASVMAALKEADMLTRKSSVKAEMALIKVQSIEQVEVDLFPAWSQDGKYYIWPHSYGDIDRADVMPLGQETIRSESLPSPRNPDALLSQNYGPNWRIPESKFKFPWRRARQRFGSFFAHWENVRK